MSLSVGRPIRAVAVLTALALALRLHAVGDSLFGDEFFTYDDTRHGLDGVFDGIERNEVTPPLYYLLAWASSQLGDSPSWLRLPSLLVGTATVPLLYALGRQVSGARTGVLAAAFVALSPFAIFYSTEARGYALLVFLVAASTVALLRALDDGRPRWWAVYALATCAALYTHYTAVFAIVVQAAWALWFHRERARAIMLANTAAAVGFVPWLPWLLDQRGKDINIAVIGSGASLSPGRAAGFVVRSFTGHPFVGLDAIPGPVAMVLMAGAAVALLAVLAVRPWPGPGHGGPAAPVLLMGLLALATPVGLVAYAALGSNLFIPRNLLASAPALAVGVAALVTSLRPRPAAAVAALLVAGLAVGTLRSLDVSYARPASLDVARFIDRTAGPGDAVVTLLAGGPVFPMEVYLHGERRVIPGDRDATAAWRHAAHGGSIFLVLPEFGPLQRVGRLAGPGSRFVLRDVRRYDRLIDVAVGRYSGKVRATLRGGEGHRVIHWSPGGDVAVVPGAVAGFLERLRRSRHGLSIRGWAADAEAGRSASRVLVFAGRRLVAIVPPTVDRPDIAKAYGASAGRAGFAVIARTGGGAHPSIHVFAQAGRRASELHPVESLDPAPLRPAG